jgi:hypothetical protein
VTITGLPSDLTNFNGGTYNAHAGTWTGTAAQFNALTFDAGEAGTFNLSITATTLGATAPTTESYTLTVNPAAPVLGGATAATVNEGCLVTLAATDTAAFADDVLGKVTITGLPCDLTNFNGGTYNAHAGTWTGTAAQFNALTFDAGEAGTFNLSITATTLGATAPTTESYTLTVNERPQIIYMTDTADPWGIHDVPGSAEYAMNQAFGAGNWTADYGYTTTPFNSNTKFIYLEGGAGDSADFFKFVASNLTTIENWVANGGHLFINSASWSGGDGNVGHGTSDTNIGFGAYLEFNECYNVASSIGQAVDPKSALFATPFEAGTHWTGDYFSHDIITGSGFQPLIVGSAGTVLAEENYGLGVVVIGGLTFPYFDSPSAGANNLLADVLVYADGSPSNVAPSPITVAAGATAEVDSPTNATVTFAGSCGTLLLAAPTTFSGQIGGIVGAGDVLDLSGFDYRHTSVAVGPYADGITTLTVTDDTHSVVLALDGNYSASAFNVTSDHHGGVDITDPPAAGPSNDAISTPSTPPVAAATIGGSAALEISGPSSEAVTFAAGTGSLVLDQPETFTGQISGFTGTAPNAGKSDVIDLAGINYNSNDFSEAYDSTTGVLTVTDGTNEAALKFVGFTGTFQFGSDGDGGTDIFDPPASGTGSSVSIGGPADDTFVFDSGNRAHTLAEFKPQADGEHGHFATDETMQQLASLVSGNHNDAAVAFDHPESVALLSDAESHLQAHLHSLAHLH